MRILFAANWWYRRGGLGAMMLDEAEELARRGHEVIPFAATHPSNMPTPWSRYFPMSLNTASLGAGMSVVEKARSTARLIHNRNASALFAEALDAAGPDVVHLHNAVRQLSPAILAVARRRHLPVVITQHDYAMMCPQGQLLKGERTPCTAPNCVRGNPLPVIAHRCIRRRLLPSVVAAAEYGVHRVRSSYMSPDRWLVAPSEFAARTLVDAGFPARRVKVLPNAVVPGPEPESVPAEGGHVLFAGRIVREKGLDVLLRAANLVPEVPIVVAGDGPLRSELETRARSSVRFVGEQTAEDLRELRRMAVAVVSPSIWYENAPLTVLEAMRDGRPAVLTSIGGQVEMIDETCGVLVEASNANDLADALRGLWLDRRRASELGSAGRRRLLERYTIGRHVDGLEALYGEALRTR